MSCQTAAGAGVTTFGSARLAVVEVHQVLPSRSPAFSAIREETVGIRLKVSGVWIGQLAQIALCVRRQVEQFNQEPLII